MAAAAPPPAVPPMKSPLPPPPQQKKDMNEVLRKAGRRALGGGIPGAVAMAMQVCTLMPLRSTMNYQYRYGNTSTMQALRTLYADGGVRRFYRGIGPALFQGPLSRFGDTAANSGMLTLLDELDSTRNLPVGVKTAAASSAAAGWRIFLMPIDAMKTTLQVEGAQGLAVLRGRIAAGGPSVLYHGAIATYSATLVGHYPWFFTFNYLQEKIPKPADHETVKKLGRNAIIGFTSSVVSDCTSNSLRVIKTTKQTSQKVITYGEAFRMITEKDGLAGLFGRGLRTRIIANGFQGLTFSVLWKALEERFNKRLDSGDKKK